MPTVIIQGTPSDGHWKTYVDRRGVPVDRILLLCRRSCRENVKPHISVHGCSKRIKADLLKAFATAFPDYGFIETRDGFHGHEHMETSGERIIPYKPWPKYPRPTPERIVKKEGLLRPALEERPHYKQQQRYHHHGHY